MPISTSWFYLQQPTISRLQVCSAAERIDSKQTLSSCDHFKGLKTYPPAYMHTDTVSATGGPYFRKERAFTRMRETRSRVPAVVQRQHSIVGSVPDLGSDTSKLWRARLPAVTSSAGANLQPCFSASIRPAHVSCPRRGWVGGLAWAAGKRSLSRRLANPPPAIQTCSTTKPRGLGKA